MKEKKKPHLYGNGGRTNMKKIRDLEGGRVKQVREENLRRSSTIHGIEQTGIQFGKRNRGLRRQQVRRHR
jgi:hypothetical protein